MVLHKADCRNFRIQFTETSITNNYEDVGRQRIYVCNDKFLYTYDAVLWRHLSAITDNWAGNPAIVG